MAKIPTIPNPTTSEAFNYEARRGRPVLFQVMKPDVLQPLYTTFLALHTSPSSIEERMTESKNVVMTVGGFVETVWPSELGALSCDSSTGAFFSPTMGLTGGSHQTIAWERKEDFLELFKMNGCVFNSVGQPVIRGRIMMIYDRGVFIGHFASLEETEESEKPFTMNLSWEFKIEQAIYSIPDTAGKRGDQFKSVSQGR